MLLIFDVTECIHARQALAEEKEKFRALTEQSLAGVYVIDKGIITYMNPRAAEMQVCCPTRWYWRRSLEILHSIF